MLIMQKNSIIINDNIIYIYSTARVFATSSSGAAVVVISLGRHACIHSLPSVSNDKHVLLLDEAQFLNVESFVLFNRYAALSSLRTSNVGLTCVAQGS